MKTIMEPTPDEDLTDLGEHPPLGQERPAWTVQDQRRLKELEDKLRDVMRNRRPNRRKSG